MKKILFLTALFTLMSTGMPWENPLEMIMRSVSGPVAFFLSVIVLVVCVTSASI